LTGRDEEGLNEPSPGPGYYHDDKNNVLKKNPEWK
jgi:hypothetical protein